jgi:hypothetical protein
MVGDLQGIADKAMTEIPSLVMPLLEASTDPEAKVARMLGAPSRGSDKPDEVRADIEYVVPYLHFRFVMEEIIACQ